MKPLDFERLLFHNPTMVEDYPTAESEVFSQIVSTMIDNRDRRDWTESICVVTCWTQGLYFAILGSWPLVDIESFQAVTGRKTDHLITGIEADHWLVNTVASLIVAIGLVLLVAAWRGRISAEISLLGITSAAALAGIDFVYVVRQTISPVYLLDAAAEVVFIAAWGGCAIGSIRSRGRRDR